MKNKMDFMSLHGTPWDKKYQIDTTVIWDVVSYKVWKCHKMNEKVDIKVTLKKKMAEQFRAVKSYLGVRNNSEVLRFLVAREYDKIAASKETEKNV